MKKSTYLFWMFAYLFVVAGWAGCGDKCSGCPEDKEFPSEMELRIPYQIGQVVRFANATGDTIVLKCTNREYSQQEQFPRDRPESECCPSYFVENVICELSDFNGNYLKIRTDFIGVYGIFISGTLDNVGYYNGGLYNDRSETLLDSIQLNGIVFYNVSTGEENDAAEIAMFLGFGGQGVIGFDINGEEWALVE